MTLGKRPFKNIVGKGENAGNQHFLLSPQWFQLFPTQSSISKSQCFLPIRNKFSVAFNLSFANAFNLDQSKILLFGKKLRDFLESLTSRHTYHEFVYHPVVQYFHKCFALRSSQAPVAQSVAKQTWEQEVAGLDLWLGQYSFRGLIIVIATEFIPLFPLGFFEGASLGKTLQSPSLVVVKPRKDMDNVSCRPDITEILLKAA